MSATKQRSSAGKKVAIFFIVFMILEGLLIFGVNFVFKNKDVTPSLAGYSMYIMDTDAMGDDVPKGALVLAANGAPSKEGISKAVLCEEVPGVGTSVFWLAHISPSADREGVVYTVFQNRDPSRLYDLKTKNIVGTATSYYVTAGKIITFMTSKFGIIALIAVPLFLLVLLELIIMIVNHSRSDYDDDEEDEDEDDEDEKPVKLDDFLFGGDNDKKLIEDSIHQGEEAAAELTDNKAPAKTVDPDEIWAAPKKHKVKIEEPDEEKPEPVKEEAPEEEAAKPAIDPSYYEKASKLIDGEKAEAEQPTEEPAPKPAAKKAVKKSSSDDTKFTKKTSSKLKSTSFEDLMKMMEEESNKLNDKLKK